MKEIVTHSSIGIDEKGTQVYDAASKAIVDEGKKLRGLFRKFKDYCEKQQENRIGWAAFTTAVQVFLLVPITLLAVNYNGNLFALWIPVIIFSFCVALCNLMALPTKITLPVFFTSALISAAVIMLSFIL